MPRRHTVPRYGPPFLHHRPGDGANVRTICECVLASLQRSHSGTGYGNGHALEGFWDFLQRLLVPVIVANPLLRTHPGAERAKTPACDTGFHCRGCSIPRLGFSPTHKKHRGFCLFMNITTWWLVTRAMRRICHSTSDGFRTAVACLGSQGSKGSPQSKSSRDQFSTDYCTRNYGKC